MGLLTPGFLLGLAAIAVPVLLHLVRRPEPAGRRFPSLMFLKRLPVRSRRRRLLRDPVLLALRCLALSLAALAFAGPYFADTGEAEGEPGRVLDRVYLLDRSYSMAYPGQWGAALDALRLHLDTLASNERAAIMSFDRGVQRVQSLTADRVRLLGALDDLRPGSGATDYAAAFDGAARLLEDSDARRREVVLISDLQRSGLHRAHPPALAADIGLEVVPLPAPAGPNAAIASARLMPAGSGSGRLTLAIRLRNTGAAPANGVRLSTVLEGREDEAAVLDLDPGSGRTLRVPLVLPSDRTVRLEVRLDAEGLTADDAFYVVSAREHRPAVLLVTPRRSGGHAGLFLKQALALAHSPAFDITMVDADALDPAALSRVDAVVLDDVPIPGGRVGAALSSFVAAGGGLLAVAAEGVRGYWPGGGDGYLPGRLGGVVERTPEVGWVFAERAARELPDSLHQTLASALGDVEIYRYRELATGGGDRVLARFDDGAPALVSREYGGGRVLAATTTFDPRWSELVASPGFAPFVIEAIRFLAGRTAVMSALTVHNRFNLDRRAVSLPDGTTLQSYLIQQRGLVVEAPAGDTVRLRPGAALYAPTRPGFHEFHPADGAGEAVPVAVNVDRTESRLATLDRQAFLRSIERPAVLQGDETAAAPAAASIQSRDRLWWFILLLAGLALAAEAWLANRLVARGGVGAQEGAAARAGAA